MEKGNIEIPSFEQVEREYLRYKKIKEIKKAGFQMIGILVVVAAISILIATNVMPVLQVNGNSMETTLRNGDIIVLHNTDKIEKGNIIGFYYQSKVLIKRVIAEEGDYVSLDANGNVYVNDIKINEPYVSNISLGDCDIVFPYQVPADEIFVLGDNREISIDSRKHEVGCIKKEQLVGKVNFRIWPLNRIGGIK